MDTENQEDDKKPSLESEYEHDSSPEPIVLPEKPAATPPEPPKTPRKHPASLVRLAMKYGADREAIEQTSTGDLAEWIEEQEIVREQERENNLRSRDVGRFQAEQRVQEPKPAPPSPDDIDWGTDEQGNPITERDIHPSLARVIKAQQKKIAELEGVSKKTAEREVSQRREAIYDAYDSAFDMIADAARYGEGSGTSLSKNSDELNRRDALIHAARLQDNESPKVMARKIVAAHKLLYGEVAAQPEDVKSGYGAVGLKAGDIPRQPNGKPRVTQEQLEQGTLSRASGRVSKEQKGRKLAARAVGEKMRELQMTDKDFEEYEEDGMPE